MHIMAFFKAIFKAITIPDIFVFRLQRHHDGTLSWDGMFFIHKNNYLMTLKNYPKFPNFNRFHVFS